MSITNSNITTEFISDFAAGRLDAEDAQVIQEAILWLPRRPRALAGRK